mgnify:CR=1 FL=1
MHRRMGTLAGLREMASYHGATIRRAIVPPVRLIPFAEQSCFIRVITLWVIEQVAQLGAQLEAQGLALKLAVNLSTRDLMDPELPHKIAQILERHRLTPARLVLEITETALTGQQAELAPRIDRPRARGLRPARDDSGTGHSALGYPSPFAFDVIKIDKSFIQDLERPQTAAILGCVLDLARRLGIDTVGEGVETEAQREFLLAHGCDQLQGMGIGAPMDAAALARWQADRRAADQPPGNS